MCDNDAEEAVRRRADEMEEDLMPKVKSILSIAFTGFLAVGLAPNARAGTHVTQSLTGTSHAPGARGRATLALTTASKGRFRVIARGLAPQSSFDLVVGGVKVGTFTSSAGGVGRVKLSTSPTRSQGLLGVDPSGKTIEVRDANGDDDLDGDIPDDGGSATGAFACCVPDDDGTECEVETPDECTSNGGTTVTGVDSCIPNPCGVTPPSEVVCCFPGSSTGAFVDDEQEAECDETDMQECAMAGGTVVQATSCEPNPCAPVPPAQVTVCCIPGQDQVACEIIPPDLCTAAQGTPNTATSCDNDPCGENSTGPNQQ
jgi:hypothetical protein